MNGRDSFTGLGRHKVGEEGIDNSQTLTSSSFSQAQEVIDTGGQRREADLESRARPAMGRSLRWVVSVYASETAGDSSLIRGCAAIRGRFGRR